MKYKGEVMVYDNVGHETMMSATHPSQIARKMTTHMKRVNPRLDRFIIYVGNENGEIWMYGVKKSDGKYLVKSLNRNLDVLNKDEIDMVFSMNVPMANLRR